MTLEKTGVRLIRRSVPGILLCLIALGCQGQGERRPERAARRQQAGAAEGAKGGAPAGLEEDAAEGGDAAGAAAEEGAAPAPPRRGGRRSGTPRSAEEAIADLSDSVQFEMAEAQHHKEQGDLAYANLDYETAIEEYEKALKLNPAMADAREKWARASLALGRRTGEVAAVQQEFSELQRVSKEQRLADARQGLKEADDLLAQADLDNAERKLRKVYEELLWFEYPIDITQMRADTKAKITDVERQKREQARTQRRQQEQVVSEQARQALDQEQKVQDQRVRELVRKAADYIRLKDYDKAIDACQRILDIRPDHRVAKFWLRDVKRQQLELRQRQLWLDQLENRELTNESIEASAVPYTDIFVFPDQAEWDRVRRRRDTLEVVSLEDPEWIAKLKRELEAKISFSFIEPRPLKDVLLFLSQYTGINILADPAIDTEAVTIENLTAREMRAVDALNQIMTVTGLAYTFKENTLFITEKEKAKGTVTFAIYNVSDILNKIRDFEGPELKLHSTDDAAGGGSGSGASTVSFTTAAAEEQGPIDPTALIELIKQGTGGDEKWTDLNTIEYHKGQLLVNAPKEMHAGIQTTLQSLRQDSDLFVVLEARFIDIHDDFLEDIGLDSRALGVGSNFGTPFGNIINNNATGGNDLGFVKQGSPVRDVTLIMGQDRWGGRLQNIIDGFTGLIQGEQSGLKGGPARNGGLTLQATWLEPFQINVILRAVQESRDVRQLTAPIVTAHNGQRVYVSVITQRAYIADYELVSGGTGFTIIEVADPVVQTFQEGVILDVDPVITPDKKYITLDVRPTMATLIGGVISTIRVSLGSFTNVAFQVPIGVPEISLQQSFTSVTVPNGGTVLLGGFKALLDQKFESYIPILGKIPLIKNLFRRKSQITEKQSLVILMTARIVDLRQDERRRHNE